MHGVTKSLTLPVSFTAAKFVNGAESPASSTA